MDKPKKKQIVPAGRVPEYASDAPELYLTKPAHRLGDAVLLRFPTRKALEAFNKKANLTALVKTPVRKGCVLYRHQVEAS